MVTRQRRNPTQRRQRPIRLNLFYLNGELHKKLFIDRPTDVIVTWNFPQEKKILYSYAQTRKTLKPAFTLKQASKFLNRGKRAFFTAYKDGMIEMPQTTKSPWNPDKWAYMLTEEDIVAAWEYFRTIHYGRPRKDGLIRPMPLPTLPELRALMRNQDMLYVKTDDGSFVPTWEANDF